MNNDWSERLAMLLQTEKMKILSAFNIVFTIIVGMVVLLQVGFVVRIELESSSIGVHFPEIVYDYAARYVNNIAFTFIPVLIIINAGREFEFAVVQRSIVSGWTRREYFMGKMIQLGIFAMLSSILASLFTLLTAALYSVPLIWDFKRLLIHFPVAFCLGSLAMLIVLVVKKSFYSLIGFVLYVLLENIIVALIPGKPILLPVHTCTRLLKEGIYGSSEFIMLAAYTFICLSSGYQKLMRSDLR